MSKGTDRRTVRIDGELWDEAKEAAAYNGDNLSAVIRDALRCYIGQVAVNKAKGSGRK